MALLRQDSYLRSAFRKAWRFYSEARKACLKAKKCAQCKGPGPFLADHIDPVIDPKTGFRGWDAYYEKMFNGPLQALCKDCHDSKSQKENKERRKTAKRNKMQAS